MILDNENRWTIMFTAGMIQLLFILIFVETKEPKILPLMLIIGFAFIFKIIEVLFRILIYFITGKET